ncbi:hypothetical protein L596_002666 [Steinernema carpocapsae]|uniref:Uncharacterized protein n=1 Tax=Steinernema carpocapsae TaxID=34508 RepID=A0A4U8USS7_STECR|nr:hypothetical protein L596_002666 [Steinernema carpocapsae]
MRDSAACLIAASLAFCCYAVTAVISNGLKRKVLFVSKNKNQREIGGGESGGSTSGIVLNWVKGRKCFRFKRLLRSESSSCLLIQNEKGFELTTVRSP